MENLYHDEEAGYYYQDYFVNEGFAIVESDLDYEIEGSKLIVTIVYQEDDNQTCQTTNYFKFSDDYVNNNSLQETEIHVYYKNTIGNLVPFLFANRNHNTARSNKK